MKKYGFGIIGCGVIADFHANAVLELAAEAELIGVCDVVYDAAEKFARRHGTKAFRNEEELLAAVDNPQEYNDTVIYPDKVRINRYYLHNYSFVSDIKMILCTVLGKTMLYNNEII